MSASERVRAQQREVRARLGIVDVVGEDLLPPSGGGQHRALCLVELGQPAHGFAADAVVVAAASSGASSPRAPARLRPARSARSRSGAGCARRRGGSSRWLRARPPRRRNPPPVAPARPPPASDRGGAGAVPSLDLQPEGRTVRDVRPSEISMTSPCTRSQPGPMKWPSTRTVTSGLRTRRAPPAKVSASPSAPGNSGASATAVRADERPQRSGRGRRCPRASRSASPAVKRSAVPPPRPISPAPRRGSGASTRAPPIRTPPREPASSMVIPSSAGAQQRVPARDGRIAQRHLHAAVAAEAGGQQRDAPPGSARAAYVDAARRRSGRSRCGRRGRSPSPPPRTPAAASIPAAATAARRSPPVSSASNRRMASTAARRLLDRCSSRASAASIRSRSPSAPHACARARLVAQVFVGERGRAGDHPRRPAAPRPAPRARRSSSVSGGRLQRPDSASAAAMRTAASSSSSSASAGRYGVGCLSVGRRDRGRRAYRPAPGRPCRGRSATRTPPPARWRPPRRTTPSAPPSSARGRGGRPGPRSRGRRGSSARDRAYRRRERHPRCYRMTRRFSDGLPR